MQMNLPLADFPQWGVTDVTGRIVAVSPDRESCIAEMYRLGRENGGMYFQVHINNANLPRRPFPRPRAVPGGPCIHGCYKCPSRCPCPCHQTPERE